METKKKKRTITRKAFTRINTKILDFVSSDLSDFRDEDLTLIKSNLDQLKDKYFELQELDKEIFDELLNDDEAEDVLEKEMELSDEYVGKFKYSDSAVQNIFNKIAKSQGEDVASVTSSKSEGQSSECKRKFKLPTLELKKFGGEIRDWLPFWGQFKKIHEDDTIDSDDKFQYLYQATIPGSKAREIVESFPSCGKNYEIAIEMLKSRFAKDDLLTEFYMRELLQITLGLNNNSIKITLSSLYDQIESKLRCLEILGVARDKYAALLFPLVESCLKEDLLRVWQRTRHSSSNTESSDSKDRLKGLMDFLKGEVESDERINLAKQSFQPVSKKPSYVSLNGGGKKESRQFFDSSKGPATAAGLVNVKTKPSTSYGESTMNNKKKPYGNLGLCIFCEGSHTSDTCFKARDMTLSERQETVKSKKCCLNCLKFGHFSKNCRTFLKCIVCNGKHVPLMCQSLNGRSSVPVDQDKNQVRPTEKSSTDQINVERSLSNINNEQIYMQTLIVKAYSDEEEYNVRVLFDSGSQRSYITKSFATKLNYQCIGEEQLVHGLFGGLNTKPQTHKKYKLRIKDLLDQNAFNFAVLDQNEICGHVPCLNGREWVNELRSKGITLNDKNTSIGVLIGSDIYLKLMTGRRENLECGLVAIETHLGWFISGKLGLSENNDGFTNISNEVISMFVNDSSLPKMWELDAIGIKDPVQTKNKEDQDTFVKNQFLETVRTNEEGRYEVTLPWLDSYPELSTNLGASKKRLEATLKKLQAEGKFDVYDKVLKEWEQNGIIEEVPCPKLEEGYYMPHRPVFKEVGTTKVRPVFDASANEKGYPSLNQCLHKGMNLLEIIPTLLLRFRKHKIGVIADIKQAFLQISLNPEDRDFTKFLWVDSDGNMKVLRHARVVFGITSSPFLLSAVIDFHLNKLVENSTNQSNKKYSMSTLHKLKKSFYVDNCVASLKSEEDLQIFIKEATEIFAEAGFELRGWEYSDNKLVDHTKTLVLGLMWDRKEDTLSVNPSCWSTVENLKTITRRTVLSVAQKIYDPIGMTCPLNICPKTILQESWDSKSAWDDELNETSKMKFTKWLQDLPYLKDLYVSRNLMTCPEEVANCSIHTFCDASKEAYATAVFIRTEYKNSEVTVELVQAKSRIKPIKPLLTIPRLELMAATIGARLTHTIKEEFNLDESDYYYWTDSEVVLAWLKREENWGVFVRNRVKEILRLSDASSWRHVPGVQNPADLPSRGCSAKTLLKSRWWEGPLWLRMPPEQWPNPITDPDENTVISEAQKKTVVFVNCDDKHTKWYYSFSNDFDKVVHVFGWILRFINNCKKQVNERKISRSLSCEEVMSAQNKIIKIVQSEKFDGVNDSKLSTLCPFVSQSGVLRIKTKVTERKDSEHFRYPVVLPSKHEVVDMIILTLHKRSCHAGVQALLSMLREEYWILRGRQTVKKVVKKCVICKRYNTKHSDTCTPPLPENRVKDAAVFEITGCDLAGPLYLKDGSKVWICLFTCAVYRAVHLELVHSLSTESFIEAFRRFVARRGKPSVIYSDNGTNFTGTQNMLTQLNWDDISRYSTSKRIDWRFNPPSAAWWGGWWERLVRLMKELLRKSLGKAKLNYEELTTILCDCESIMNSRPLTYLSEDSSDLTVLTPNMFLQDIKTIGIPDFDEINARGLNKRMKYRQELMEGLRRRFRNEYLGQLTLNQKTRGQPFKIGEIVLIETENKKRIDWPLGKIEKTILGKDGECRLVKVKTAGGCLLRPIQRIYRLEIESSKEQEDISKVIKIDGLKTNYANEKKIPNKLGKVKRKKEIKLSTTTCGRNVKMPIRYCED